MNRKTVPFPSSLSSEDLSPVGFDDILDDGQPQPGPRRRSLVRNPEEGFEDPGKGMIRESLRPVSDTEKVT